MENIELFEDIDIEKIRKEVADIKEELRKAKNRLDMAEDYLGDVARAVELIYQVKKDKEEIVSIKSDKDKQNPFYEAIRANYSYHYQLPLWETVLDSIKEHPDCTLEGALDKVNDSSWGTIQTNRIFMVLCGLDYDSLVHYAPNYPDIYSMVKALGKNQELSNQSKDISEMEYQRRTYRHEFDNVDYAVKLVFGSGIDDIIRNSLTRKNDV